MRERFGFFDAQRDHLRSAHSGQKAGKNVIFSNLHASAAPGLGRCRTRLKVLFPNFRRTKNRLATGFLCGSYAGVSFAGRGAKPNNLFFLMFGDVGDQVSGGKVGKRWGDSRERSARCNVV